LEGSWSCVIFNGYSPGPCVTTRELSSIWCDGIGGE
jgi:hypothetical protein